MGFPTPSGDFKAYAEQLESIARKSRALGRRVRRVEEHAMDGERFPEAVLEQLQELARELTESARIVDAQLNRASRHLAQQVLTEFSQIPYQAPEQLPVVIYADVEDESPAWTRLHNAISDLATTMGYWKPELVEHTTGSVFRWEDWKRRFSSKEVTDRLAKVEHAIDLQQITKHQSTVDSAEAQAFADVCSSLKDVPRACIRVGSLLFVKYQFEGEDVVLARTLSLPEMVALDKFPEIQRNPENALSALATAVGALDSTTIRALPPMAES